MPNENQIKITKGFVNKNEQILDPREIKKVLRQPFNPRVGYRLTDDKNVLF